MAIRLPKTDLTAADYHPAKDWLAKCRAEHDLCGISLLVSKPRRLLKIGSRSDTKIIRLLEYDKSTEQYTALSYC